MSIYLQKAAFHFNLLKKQQLSLLPMSVLRWLLIGLDNLLGAACLIMVDFTPTELQKGFRTVFGSIYYKKTLLLRENDEKH